MKCIVTGQETKVMFRNIPLSREGRFKLYETRDKIIDLLIEKYGFKEFPKNVAKEMVQVKLKAPINNRMILQCYKKGKNPFEVYNVSQS